MKKRIMLFLIILIIILGGSYFIFNRNTTKKISEDARKFKNEYQEVAEDNMFVFKKPNEIINILKYGTGIIYLGFPECPWCHAYVKYIYDVAKENHVDKIYYLNILDERKNNSIEYQEIVNLLKNYLQYDEEGNKKIYVPAVIAVNEGKIVGFDDETSYDTKGYKNPDEYWQKEDLNSLKRKLKEMFLKAKLNYCVDCNN